MTTAEPSPSRGQRALLILYCANHIIVVLLTGFIIYIAGWESRVTSLHARFCTIGYVLLMSNALMTLSPWCPLSRQLKSRTRSHVHWCLQLLGGCFTLSGIIILYLGKKNHLKSIHSILGITSIVLMIFLGISGPSVFYAYQLRKFLKPVGTKAMHNFLGIACFTIGIASQCYGYNKQWMVKKSGQDIATLCIVLTAISSLICLYRPITSLYRQVCAMIGRG